MNRLLLAAILGAALAGSRSSAAQSLTLSGHVLSSSGGPAPYTTIEVTDARERAFAAADGSFTFAGLVAGRHNLRVRQLGFLPLDTVVTLPGNGPVEVTLHPVIVRLADVRVSTPASCRRSAIDSIGDPALKAIVSAVRDNAEREIFLRSAYRFQYTREDARQQTDTSGRRLRPDVDTLRFTSDALVPYHRGAVVYSDTSVRGQAHKWMRLPSSLDFADPAFVAAHCLEFAGIKGGSYVIAFRPLESIFTPDVEGTVSIDTATFVIRASLVRLTKPFKVDEALQSLEARSTYREILPTLGIVADVESEEIHTVAGRSSKATDRQRLLSIRFLDRAPAGLPVENVFH